MKIFNKIKDWLYADVSKDGKLEFENIGAFARKLAELKGERVQVSIERRKKRRSIAENSYYWGVVIPILCEWSGYTEDEMHDSLKEKFLYEFDERTGLARIGSTANLTTEEFEKLMRNIRMWASEQGIFIPLPNEEIY
jgi:hypothetical protein